MFASLIVVLPSAFTGGAVHLTHGGQELVLDSSAASLTKTTVLAWYTDVKHEVKPITSGYRVALAYNLLRTSTTLSPSLSPAGGLAAQLRHILLSWKHSQPKCLDKLVYKLEHSYSHANLSASALKGSDAHLVSILDELATELGFCMGLGQLEHKVSGPGADYGDSDDEDVEMAEVYDRTNSVDELVDLDGVIIETDIDFDSSELVPKDFEEDLEKGPPDDQEYEGYMGNVGPLMRCGTTKLIRFQGAGTLDQCEFEIYLVRRD